MPRPSLSCGLVLWSASAEPGSLTGMHPRYRRLLIPGRSGTAPGHRRRGGAAVSSPVLDSLDDARTVVRELLTDDVALVRASFSGRQRNTTVPFRRAELRYVDLKSGRRLQVTTYDETQAFTRNVDLGTDTELEIDSLVTAGYANWHVETTRETVQLRSPRKAGPS